MNDSGVVVIILGFLAVLGGVAGMGYCMWKGRKGFSRRDRDPDLETETSIGVYSCFSYGAFVVGWILIGLGAWMLT